MTAEMSGSMSALSFVISYKYHDLMDIDREMVPIRRPLFTDRFTVLGKMAGMRFLPNRLLSPTEPVVASIKSWNPGCAQDINPFTAPTLG
jgi:hypothetical protein